MGSIPVVGFRKNMDLANSMFTDQGQVPKWPTGSDCKSDGVRLRGFESLPAHWLRRPHSSGVERILGKNEVMGSNPIEGSGNEKYLIY